MRLTISKPASPKRLILLDDVGMHPAVDQEVRTAGVVDLADIDFAHVHEARKVELVRYSLYLIEE